MLPPISTERYWSHPVRRGDGHGSRYSPASVGSSQAPQVVALVASGIAGLLVGSFLNVVAYRLPQRLSIVHPPSHCPTCAARLRAIDLVPVASWLVLRARCRHCHAPISLRYPLVELAAAVLFAAAAGALGSLWPLPPIAIVLACALAAVVVDADGHRLPPAIGLVAACGALCLLPIAVALGHLDRIGWAALGAGLTGVAALAVERPGPTPRWSRVALLGALGLSAGWLWPGGGPTVAAWVVTATAATGTGAARRAPLAVVVAGSVLALFAAAVISRP